MARKLVRNIKSNITFMTNIVAVRKISCREYRILRKQLKKTIKMKKVAGIKCRARRENSVRKCRVRPRLYLAFK